MASCRTRNTAAIGRVTRVAGGSRGDRIYGLPGGADLAGADRDDLLEGAAGRDTLSGGDGSDRLQGMAGDVVVFDANPLERIEVLRAPRMVVNGGLVYQSANDR